MFYFLLFLFFLLKPGLHFCKYTHRKKEISWVLKENYSWQSITSLQTSRKANTVDVEYLICPDIFYFMMTQKEGRENKKCILYDIKKDLYHLNSEQTSNCHTIVWTKKNWKTDCRRETHKQLDYTFVICHSFNNFFIFVVLVRTIFDPCP